MNNQNENIRNASQDQKKKDGIAKKVGDSMERAGEKIAEKGAPGLGSSVKKPGDKIEHSQDNSRKAR